MSIPAETPQRVAFVTLGCKVNQYETQAFREGLPGFTEVPASAPADVFVVNTCTVTKAAEDESRALIRRLARRNPNARVVVTGCLVGRDGTHAGPVQGATETVGTEAKNQVAPLVRRLTGRALPLANATPSSVHGLNVTKFGERTRAFVKLQDGCALRCTYCIIPTVRGALRSREETDVLAEVRALAANGWREVVLTGVHLGHYGREGDPLAPVWRPEGGRRSRLANLLRALGEVDGIDRIRLSSLESVELGPALLDVLAASPRFVPHFHLPLQSGSDRVLKLMNRRYDAASFLRGLDEIARRWERPSISTDVIVGFPGETEQDFEQTRETCRRAGFSRLHVFSYSDRQGTPATSLPGKLAKAEQKARTRALIDDGERLAHAYASRFLGETVSVLVEGKRDRETGHLQGYTERYVKVRVDGPDALRGKLVPVRVAGVAPDGTLTGR